jgi:hypothetical protein
MLRYTATGRSAVLDRVSDLVNTAGCRAGLAGGHLVLPARERPSIPGREHRAAPESAHRSVLARAANQADHARVLVVEYYQTRVIGGRKIRSKIQCGPSCCHVSTRMTAQRG